MIKTTAAVGLSVAALSLAIGLASACAINPQPLPPDTFDGSVGTDAGAFGDQNGRADDAAASPAADTEGGAGGGANNDAGDGDGGPRSTDGGDAGITDASYDGSD